MKYKIIAILCILFSIVVCSSAIAATNISIRDLWGDASSSYKTYKNGEDGNRVIQAWNFSVDGTYNITSITIQTTNNLVFNVSIWKNSTGNNAPVWDSDELCLGDQDTTAANPGNSTVTFSTCPEIDTTHNHYWVIIEEVTHSVDAQGVATHVDTGAYTFTQPNRDFVTSAWTMTANTKHTPLMMLNATAGGVFGETINLSSWYVPDASVNYTSSNIVFNTTLNASYTNFTAVLWINDTIYQSQNNSAGQNVFTNFTQSLSDGYYKYKIEVFNNESGANSTEVTFFVDTGTPSITADILLRSNQSYSIGNNLIASINFSDEHLYAINITIDNTTTIFNLTNIDGNFYYYNMSFNPDDYDIGIGVHNLLLEVSDSHTAKRISDWIHKKNPITKTLKYEFNSGKDWIKVTPKNTGWFSDSSTWKDFDRYKFKFEKGIFGKKDLEFVVTSSQEIDLVDSEYKAHMVVYNLRKWIDFETDYDYETTAMQINPYEVSVLVKGVERDDITFKSIGGLNTYQEQYSFYYGNITETFENTSIELQPLTYIINISINDSFVDDINATFNFNGSGSVFDTYYANKESATNYISFTQSVTAPRISPLFTDNRTFFWNFSIYGINDEVNYTNITTPKNLTIDNRIIDNCSDYYMMSVNMTFKNATDETELAASADGYFELWNDDEANPNIFNLTWGSRTSSGICIYPNWSSYNISGQVEYTDGVRSSTYYFQNIIFDNTTQNIDMFLTDGTSSVTFTVLDENADPVQDVYIYVLQYDLGTDSYITTQIIKTDVDGEAVGDIILNTQRYKFILYLNGDIVKETEPSYITSTTQIIRINLLADYFENYDSIANIAYTFEFDNATKEFTFTYSDATGQVHLGCLHIIKRSPSEDIDVNSTCVSSSATTILRRINEDVGKNTYVGTAKVSIGTEWFTLDSIAHTFDYRYKTFGEEGILASFFIVLSLVMIGVWSPVVAVVLMMAGMLFTIAMGLFHISWSVFVAFLILGGITIFRLNRR